MAGLLTAITKPQPAIMAAKPMPTLAEVLGAFGSATMLIKAYCVTDIETKASLRLTSRRATRTGLPELLADTSPLIAMPALTNANVATP
jgi:hypothetical protein